MYRAAYRSALALALLNGATMPVAAAAPCSNDAFSIDGNAVTVQVCLSTTQPVAAGHRTPAKPAQASLEETLAAKGQPTLVRTVALDAAPTDEASRTIDDVPLEKLGIAKTLHLTLAVKTGSVRVEHALLVPGAVTLK